MNAETLRTPETIRTHPLQVATLHTDGSASIVHGFTLQDNMRKKDLARRNSVTNPLVFHITKGPNAGTSSISANQWDAIRARAGNEKLTVLAGFTCAPESDGNDIAPIHLLDTYREHDDVYNDLLRRTEGLLLPVTNHVELDEVMKSDKLGIIKSIEGVYGEYNMKDIEEIVKRGTKIWTVWWNFSDQRTGADNTAKVDTGLTTQGREFMQVLSRDLKVAVDVSHASDRTSWGVLESIAEVNGIPAIASHSGSREVFNHKRNLPNDLAIAIAKRGGIIGLPATATFNGNFSGFINHALHFKDLGIIDSIAFGPDFDGMPQARVIPELNDAEVAGASIAKGLKAARFTEEEIRGVLFDNAYRYMSTHLFSAAKG